MDTKNESTNPFVNFSTNPFDDLPIESSTNPFENSLPEISNNPPADLPSVFMPTDLPPVLEIVPFIPPPDDLPPVLNPLDIPPEDAPPELALYLMREITEDDIVPPEEMALIRADTASLSFLSEKKLRVDNLSQKLSTINYNLQPTHSLWESLRQQYKESSLIGKATSYTAPAALTLGGGGLKLVGLAIPSLAIGMAAGMTFGIWAILGMMSNDASSNSENDAAKQKHNDELAAAIKIVFRQLFQLCEQLAMENLLYKKELNILTEHNNRLAEINQATEQQLVQLDIIRHSLTTQMEKFRQLTDELKNDLESEKTLRLKSYQELELQVQYRKEQLESFKLKNQEYQVVMKDMKLLNENSEQKIALLKGTIQKLTEVQALHLADKEVISHKLQKIFTESEQSMHKILVDMSEKNVEYQENIETFKKNNQKMTNILLQEAVFSAQMEEIMNHYKPQKTDTKQTASIAAYVSSGFLGRKVPENQAVNANETKFVSVLQG